MNVPRVYGTTPKRIESTSSATASMWRGVLGAIRGYYYPNPRLLRRLSYALFDESEASERNIRIRFIKIAQCLHLGALDHISEAWDELLAWMEEIAIDEDEIARRAKSKRRSAAEYEEPSSHYEYAESSFVEEGEYTAVPTTDDSTALTRSAARFEEIAPEDADDDVIQPTSAAYEDEYGWMPIEDVPDRTRELVELGRERAEELSGIGLPESIQAFLGHGVIEYDHDNPPYEFWGKVRALFTAERGADGDLTYMDEPAELSDLIYAIIAEEERWIPVEEMPEVMRDLIAESRARSINLFGGNLSWYNRDDECKYDEKRYAHIRFLLEDGLIRHSKTTPASKFWNDLKNLLFENDPETLVNLARPVVALMEEWIPIEKVPEKRRKLVNALRTKAVELYVQGHRYSTKSHMLKLLVDGSIVYFKEYPARKYWPKVRQTLIWPAKDEPPWVMDLIRPAIAEKESWLPLKQIPSVVRELVNEARTKAIELYGGNFSGSFETIDGWKSGSLACSPIRQFVKDGTIRYSTKNLPEAFFRRCGELLFGLERLSDGRFRRVKVPEKIVEMLARMEKQGKRAWDFYESAQTVAHPGTAKKMQRMRAIRPSVATASHITSVYAQEECSLSFGGEFNYSIYGGHEMQFDLAPSFLSAPLLSGGFKAVSIMPNAAMGLSVTGAPLR